MRIVRSGLGAAIALATACAAVPAASKGSSGSVVYWPGHLRASYEFHGYGPFRSDRSDRMIDPIAIASVIGLVAAGPRPSEADAPPRPDQIARNYATHSCAAEAEERLKRRARVVDIGTVDRGSDGYTVRGTMAGREDSYRFLCTTRYGTVMNVDFTKVDLADEDYGLR